MNLGLPIFIALSLSFLVATFYIVFLWYDYKKKKRPIPLIELIASGLCFLAVPLFVIGVLSPSELVRVIIFGGGIFLFGLGLPIMAGIFALYCYRRAKHKLMRFFYVFAVIGGVLGTAINTFLLIDLSFYPEHYNNGMSMMFNLMTQVYITVFFFVVITLLNSIQRLGMFSKNEKYIVSRYTNYSILLISSLVTLALFTGGAIFSFLSISMALSA